MALDRQNTSIPYCVGRLIAITEHYANEHFGQGTLTSMISTPKHYLDAFSKYINPNDEYINDIACDIPASINSEVDKGKVWVGYYHQKAEYSSHRERG